MHADAVLAIDLPSWFLNGYEQGETSCYLFIHYKQISQPENHQYANYSFTFLKIFRKLISLRTI